MSSRNRKSSFEKKPKPYEMTRKITSDTTSVASKIE